MAHLGEVVAVDVEDCDLTDTAAIVSLVEKVKPSLIVNPAAYTAVDRAEVETEIACAINATAPKVLAAQANLLHIPIIHYSTDYILMERRTGSMSKMILQTRSPSTVKLNGRARKMFEPCARTT